ncbi:MAG: hypothetical protein ACRDK3_07805 [Actinomycetota bacterium]
MDAAHKQRTNLGVGLGLGVQIAGRVLQGSPSSATAALGALLVAGGLAVFVWGCAMYMQGKGYHSAWGLLGLLSVIGLIVLVLLRDRQPEKMASPRVGIGSIRPTRVRE